MTTASRLADVEAAEEFLQEAKTLQGPPPKWADSKWGGEYTATWVVLDSLDAPAGQLRFTVRKADTSVASIHVIFQNHPIWRVDLDYDHICHSNPLDGHLQGLDAQVCGSHSHAWDINKQNLLSQDLWSLKYRRPIPKTIRRLGQALLWLSDEINITIEREQRGFDGPTRADLFDRSGL